MIVTYSIVIVTCLYKAVHHKKLYNTKYYLSVTFAMFKLVINLFLKFKDSWIYSLGLGFQKISSSARLILSMEKTMDAK